MKTRAYSLALLAVLTVASAANAAEVKNISTGIDPLTGLKLPNNSTDTNWVIAAGGTGGSIGINPIARSTPLPNVFVADDASSASRWIAVNTNAGLEGITAPAGTYRYQTTVDLTGYIVPTAQLASIRFSVDNTLLQILINDVLVFTPPQDQPNNNPEKFHDLPDSLGTGLFVPGINTITFVINNSELVEAFRYEGSVTADAPPSDIPEPASLAFLAAAPALLLTRRRK